MSDDKKSLTDKIVNKLRSRYREEFFVHEFKDAPSGASHWADILVICLHPSRGKLIEYFEIKTLRSDWLKELNTPSKSENIAKHCDKIWLVTSDDKIAKLDEIPATWGWMYLKGQRLTILKDAPIQEPMFNKDFVITLAQYSKREFNHAVMEAESKAYDEAKINIEKRYDQDYWKRQADHFEKLYDDNQIKWKAFNDFFNIYSFRDVTEAKAFGMLCNSVWKMRTSMKDLRYKDMFNSMWALNTIQGCLNEIKNNIKKLREIDITLPKENAGSAE